MFHNDFSHHNLSLKNYINKPAAGTAFTVPEERAARKLHCVLVKVIPDLPTLSQDGWGGGASKTFPDISWTKENL